MSLELTDKQIRELVKKYRFVEVVDGNLQTDGGEPIEIPALPQERTSVTLYEHQIFDLQEFSS